VLHRKEIAHEAEGQIRTLFGSWNRQLTTAERKYIHRWTEEWCWDISIIKYAYELTVDATGKATMRYADAILKRWYENQLTTLEQIEKAEEQWQNEKEKKQSAKSKKTTKNSSQEERSSFDVDDFFEAALKRSYQDM